MKKNGLLIKTKMSPLSNVNDLTKINGLKPNNPLQKTR